MNEQTVPFERLTLNRYFSTSGTIGMHTHFSWSLTHQNHRLTNYEIRKSMNGF
ncbi:MAG: hypothetical protein RJQ09_09370 [Cyclobacteriaceae bacterium]